MAKKSAMYQRSDGLYEKIITIDGKRKAFRARTEKEVWTKILEYQGEVEKGPLFKDIAEAWKEEHDEESPETSHRWYTAAYNRAVDEFGEERIKQIQAIDVTNFLKQFARKGYAKKTVITQKSIIAMIFDMAISEGYVEMNPATYAKLPKNLQSTKREAPTEKEIEIVKQSINAPFGLFALFLLYTGCRRGEALAIQYKDIDRENNLIHITKAIAYATNQPIIKEPKTESGKRSIILLSVLKEILPNGKPSHYLFSATEGKTPLTNSQVESLWHKYQAHTKLSITAHQLRHAYATILYEAGIDEKMAQDLLGHSDISVTRNIYTHIRQTQKQTAADVLNAFMK